MLRVKASFPVRVTLVEQLDTVQGRQGCQQAGVQAHGQQVP